MLTAEGCAARRQRLWGALPAGCDALIVAAPEHLIYFAGTCRRRSSSGRSNRPRCWCWNRAGRPSWPTTCSGRSSIVRPSTR